MHESRSEHRVTDNLDLLFAALPDTIRQILQRRTNNDELLEIVLDLGRLPEARYLQELVTLLPEPVQDADLQHVIERVGEFGDDNRAGIERTLHRISAIRNRRGKIIGMTCRVGRAVYGTVALVRDVIEQGRSMLILGRPGVGKTTILREVARVLADDLGKRVVIVDTSNEIAGDGDVPHPGIGRARRMQVARPAEQHAVMIEAVENHMPEVIIIDEIGTELEALAARTIAERGVQLIGTAHGNTLDNLLMNPTLSDLVGGIGTVTLGDEEARRRGTQKTVLERKAPPTFDVVVEQQDRLKVLIHANVADAVDSMLRGEMPSRERRVLDENGHLSHNLESARPATIEELRGSIAPRSRGFEPMRAGGEDRRPRNTLRQRPHDDHAQFPDNDFESNEHRASARKDWNAQPSNGIEHDLSAHVQRKRVIYPLGISRARLEQVIFELNVQAIVGVDEQSSDTILVLKSLYRKQPDRVEHAHASGKAVYILRTGTVDRLRDVIADLFGVRTNA